MTAAYAIAKRFPIEARRHAAGLDYSCASVLGTGARRATAAHGEEFCPLGACLTAMGKRAYTPNGRDVARALGETGTSVRGVLIWKQASSFIRDWDEGVIENLADALGVAP